MKITLLSNDVDTNKDASRSLSTIEDYTTLKHGTTVNTTLFRLSTIEDYTTLKRLIERTRLSHGLSTIEDYTTLKR